MAPTSMTNETRMGIGNLESARFDISRASPPALAVDHRVNFSRRSRSSISIVLIARVRQDEAKHARPRVR
jgi:hypothetical protein